MKERILEGAIRVYKTRGVKFTMDDLAKELAMSKKTIYTIFPDKGQLMLEMVDYTFDAIKESEEKVLNDDSLDTIEKLRGVLSVMPDKYHDVDFTQMYVLRGKYPAVYKRMQERLESGWESTLSLIHKGQQEGKIKDINITVFQIAYEAATERFLSGDELEGAHIEYIDALSELVNILLEGILA